MCITRYLVETQSDSLPNGEYAGFGAFNILKAINIPDDNDSTLVYNWLISF